MCGQGRWSGYPFSGPRSRAYIPALADYCANTAMDRGLCGNREWGLRPDTQITYPTRVVTRDRWRAKRAAEGGWWGLRAQAPFAVATK